MITFWITLGSVIVFIAILAFISRIFYHRSLMASIVALYLRITVKKISDEEVEREIPSLPLKNDCEYKVPSIVKFKTSVKEEKYQNMPVFYLNCNEIDAAIIYLHGAGYVRQPRIHHWKFINKLAKKTNITTIVPVYPKAPNHKCLEVYELLTKFYQETRDKYKKIIVIGDSSGGGLALGLCEHFMKQGIKLPDHLILMSPWVDVALNNKDIPEYQKKDPLISASNEKVWGKSWAGTLAVEDWRVSPINGCIKGLCSTTLFAGTREILYPDVKLMYEKLKKEGNSTEFIIGRGLNHVYPIYPIPEARKALKQINERIQRIIN